MDSGHPLEQQHSAERFFANRNSTSAAERIRLLEEELSEERKNYTAFIKDAAATLKASNDALEAREQTINAQAHYNLAAYKKTDEQLGQIIELEFKLNRAVDISHLTPEQAERARAFVKALTKD